MVQIEPSKTGEPTVRLGRRSLVSRYAPRREAERFIGERLTGTSPGTVVILGEVLGYLSSALHDAYPGASVVAVYLSSETVSHRVDNTSLQQHAIWHPEHQLPFNRFLEAELSEHQIDRLEVLEWQPATEAFPELAERLRGTIRAVVRRLTAGVVTAAYFGPRWFRNAFFNYLSIERYAHLRVPRGATIAIAASGPSLERYLPELAAYQGRLVLGALPSAVSALVQAGIRPEFVVHTDGGEYAAEHLAPLRGHDVPIVMPWIAGRGIHRLGLPVAPFSQGGIVEHTVCGLNDRPVPAVPANGTVAGSALELALLFRPQAIVFIGLDLCTEDLALHVRPHAFEHYYQRGVTRLRPYLTTQFTVAEPLSRVGRRARRSSALETYADWFSGRLQTCATPVYRVPRSATVLSGFTAELESLTELPTLPTLSTHSGMVESVGADRATIIPAPGSRERTRRVRTALQSLHHSLSELPRAAVSLAGRRVASIEELEASPARRALQLAHYLDPHAVNRVLGSNLESVAEYEPELRALLADTEDHLKRVERRIR